MDRRPWSWTRLIAITKSEFNECLSSSIYKVLHIANATFTVDSDTTNYFSSPLPNTPMTTEDHRPQRAIVQQCRVLVRGDLHRKRLSRIIQNDTGSNSDGVGTPPDPRKVEGSKWQSSQLNSEKDIPEWLNPRSHSGVIHQLRLRPLAAQQPRYGGGIAHYPR